MLLNNYKHILSDVNVKKCIIFKIGSEMKSLNL